MGASAPSLDTPLVLIGHEGRKRVVLAADQAARRAGLSVGMPAEQSAGFGCRSCHPGRGPGSRWRRAAKAGRLDAAALASPLVTVISLMA